MTTPPETASGLREELGQDTAHLGDTLKTRAKDEAETRKGAAVGIAGSASGTFLAIAAAAGFAAARVLRAGADHKRHGQHGGGAEQSSQQGYDAAPVWPADENVMPTDTGTGFTPSYGAEGGTIR